MQSGDKLDISSSSVEHADKNERTDEVLTESSVPPMSKPLPSGRNWIDPDTYSQVPSSIPIGKSSIPFGLASQAATCTPSIDDASPVLLLNATNFM